MIKRVLLSVLALAILIPAAGLAYLYWKKPNAAPSSSIQVARTPERLERGRYLFTTVLDCDGCHSERDMTRIGLPVIESGRGRGNVLSQWIPALPGTVVAANITPDPETGIGRWTDGEKIRAIRDGVDRDGRALFPMMPYQGFRQLSDEDVESLVAFLDSLPPLRYELPVTKLSFPVNLMTKGVPQPAGAVAPPDRSDRLKYGEYLVAVGGCIGCHTPAQRGQPVAGKEYAGGEKFESPYGTVFSANITPDHDTGIGKWDEEFFIKKFYDYRDYAEHGSPKMSGPDQFTVMPWLALCRMTREDLGAIYTYLRTVKPVKNAVETHPKKS
jgi:mono/diheme cytochrome c family protein